MNKYVVGFIFLMWIAGATAAVVRTIEFQIKGNLQVWQAVALILAEIYLLIVVPVLWLAK